jgi:hypothetical protein
MAPSVNSSCAPREPRQSKSAKSQDAFEMGE